MNRRLIITAIVSVYLAFASGGILAQEFTVGKEDVKGDEPDYSPYVDRNIPVRVFWGDTHHHTSYSPDAGLVGNTLGPDAAYRFARGEEVTSSSGLRAKLVRPLDFLVVTDHAEYIGLAPMLRNSDRIQIIKGWLDAKGETHEKVFDVALSDGRRPDPRTGKVPPVGNTVDVANATWTNTIGDPLLVSYWKDPEFDASQRAFYYVRVIEIPTPRWTAYDAKRFGITMPSKVPMTVTDRAYTSPIWYTP